MVERVHFRPGFGCTIGDAVQASCSAYPFFERKTVTTAAGDHVELVDGGYCANNPTLYAVADAIVAMKVLQENLRVVSLGVGVYPEPKPPLLSKMRWYRYLRSVQLLQKTLEINTQSMDQLREILFKQIPTVRISDTFEKPEMATDLFEHDLKKLNILRQRGSESFASREPQLKQFPSIVRVDTDYGHPRKTARHLVTPRFSLRNRAIHTRRSNAHWKRMIPTMLARALKYFFKDPMATTLTSMLKAMWMSSFVSTLSTTTTSML